MSALMKKIHLLLAAGCIVIATGCAERSPADPDTGAGTTATATPEWVRDAVIYEVFVRNFTPEGTFRAVIPRLPELKALGVTTLWLMPIHPVGELHRKGTFGSPYSIRDFFAVNPEYGTEDDFRALVQAVHDQGMHVIIDFVANHTAWDNAWLQEHPDWYTRDSTGQVVAPVADWTDVADLNYDNPEVAAEMKRALTYWVREFDIDGYRCDVAEMVPGTFWSDAIAELRAIKPVLMLAEGAAPELHAYGFDLTYAWPFYHQLKEVWNGAPASELVALVDSVDALLPDGAARLRFTTNHDETAWDAPPVVLFDGQEGARAAAVVAFTLPGVPLVYNGQEVGSDARLPLFEKMEIDWSQHPETRAFYDRLLDVRATSTAVREGDLEWLVPEAADVIVFEREHEGERVVVAVNVRAQDAAVTLPASAAGGLTDVWTGEPIDGATLVLPPFGYHILRTGPAVR